MPTSASSTRDAQPSIWLIRTLADVASKGGNFLLNVGPTASGEIPRPSVERLEAVGTWLRRNGESIYGTQASPFKRLPWGRCTRKSTAAGGTALYLHVFEWPEDGRLVVPGIGNEIRKAYLLADENRTGLQTQRTTDEVIILVPAKAPHPADSVVVVEITPLPVVIQ